MKSSNIKWRINNEGLYFTLRRTAVLEMISAIARITNTDVLSMRRKRVRLKEAFLCHTTARSVAEQGDDRPSPCRPHTHLS